MRVSKVSFLHDGSVGIVTMTSVDPDEYEFVFGQEIPKGLGFPVVIEYNAEDTAALFHRAGKVPGDHADASVSSEIYNALMAVVDRLIEYDL